MTGIYLAAGPSFERLAQALGDVARERQRQDEKWGDQSHHPDGTGDQEHVLRALQSQRTPHAVTLSEATSGTLAYLAKTATDAAAARGTVTWAAILLEEVFEALAADGDRELRTELVQVAAVAVQWIEVLDGRQP